MKLGVLCRAVAGAAYLAGCGPLTDSPVGAPAGAQQQDIVGGTVDGADPAVVALALPAPNGGYDEFCSGTLVGPKTVLTAAHCIGDYPQYFVVFGGRTSQPARAIRMRAQVSDPGYDGTRGDDFGLVRLATAVTDIAPIPLNTAPVTAAWLGLPIRHAGFGVTDGTTQTRSDAKREVSYALRQIMANEIESGAAGKQTCSGDSGGPGFMVPPGGTSEVLVGVVSWGDQDCAVQGWDGRVDAALDSWIRPTMDAWEVASCATGNECKPGCTPVDQDCVCVGDGVCSPDCLDPSTDPDCPRDCAANGICSTRPCGRPDPDCVELGGACISQFVCATRVCVGDSQHSQPYCTRACAAAADCPSGLECRESRCEFPLKPQRQRFEPCDAATEYCVGAVCSGPIQDGAATRCVVPCVSEADCGPGGGACEGGVNGAHYCRPAGLNFTAATITSVGTGARVASLSPAAGCSAVGALTPMLWAGAALLTLSRRRRTRE